MEETLPTGFSYVEDSVMPSDVRVSMAGGAVRFTVRGTDQFSYKVMASDMDGSYSFMGVLRDDQKMEYTVTGDSAVAVGVVANRTLSATTVRPGAGLTVTITAGGYDTAGARIEETLPNGFSYVEDSVSEDDIRVTEQDRTVRFTIRGTESFTYGVMASNTPGAYIFMGVLRDADRTTHTVGGDNSVTVEAPATATPTPTVRPPRRRSGGGGGGGYAPPVATATPMPTRAPSAPVATIAPMPTPIIVPTIVAPTAAPTAKPEPTAVPPTAVQTPRPTARVVVPTVVPTVAPPEPTEVPKPTAVPPTAAPPTEAPPTAMVEPTEPPAPTATIAPTVAPVTPVTPDEGGMPTWLIILIIVIIVAVVIGAVGFYMMRMRR